METKATTLSEFPNGEKAIVEQTPVSEDRIICKRRTVRVTVRDPNTKVNHVSKVTSDTKIIVHQVHGTIISTGITCKKILCCMCDSACRWFDC